MSKNNTASTNNEDTLILKAYLEEDKVTLSTNTKASQLVPVIAALLIFCTKDMLSKEKILDGHDDMVNFILGASLLSNKAFQDAVYDRVFGQEDKPGKKDEVIFL